MKRKLTTILATAVCTGVSTVSWAGQATTSAVAGSPGLGTGTAAATADYRGDGPGYATTQTRSGRVNLARGIAVGFDRDGLSLSTSYGVAGHIGPAVAGTLSVNIGLNGQVATSIGRTVARGDRARTVSVAGGSGSRRGPARAWATSTGRTGPRGEVMSMAKSNHARALFKRAPLRRAPRRFRPSWGIRR